MSDGAAECASPAAAPPVASAASPSPSGAALLKEVRETLDDGSLQDLAELIARKKQRLLEDASLETGDRPGGEESAAAAGGEPSTSTSAPAVPPVPIGTLVRFRATNGKWYYGTVTELVPPVFGGPPLAHLRFAHPTSGWMRLPMVLPVGALTRVPGGALPQPSTSLAPGTRLWARPQADGLWESAELEGADRHSGGRFSLVLSGSGRRCVLAASAAAVAEHVHAPKGFGEEIESSSSSSGSDSDEEDGRDNDGASGLSGGLNAGAGAQKDPDTVLFAGWEAHTRGVASRMLLQMGFKGFGAGLGREGEGRAVPLQVGMHGAGTRGLGSGGDDERKLGDAAPMRGKKGGGGAKKRAQKAAQEAKQAERAEEDANPGLFAFLNRTLAVPGSIQGAASSQPQGDAGKKKAAGASSAGAGAAAGKGAGAAADSRVQLMRQQDGIQALKAKQQKYQEMLLRNKNDKTVAAAVSAKLAEIRRDLAQAESARASAATAVAAKPKKFKF